MWLRKSGCVGEVAECQRSHESEILSPSHLCLIHTWMKSQIGDVGSV